MSARLPPALRSPALGALEQGMVGAVVWSPVELMALGSADPALWWVTLTLFAVVGIAVGSSIAIVEALIAKLSLAGWAAAGVRAAVCMPVIVLGTRALFQGAFASTLPGADLAPVWVPVTITIAIAIAAKLVDRLLTEGPKDSPHRPALRQFSGRRGQLAVVVVAAAVLVELVNRTIKPSEYDELHTMLILVVCIAVALGLRIVRFCSNTPAIIAPVFAVLLSFTLGLGFGLSSPKQRTHVAAHGMHTRLLVRQVHALVDFDRDGYSASFGGADCDDFDAGRNPGAKEVAGNDLDENCDLIIDRREAHASTDSGEPPLDNPHATATDRDRAADEDASLVIEADNVEHIVLVTVDALRADAMPSTPPKAAELPNLAALIGQSRQFVRAFSPAAGTDLSLSTLVSGQVDPFSGVDTTLAESLRAAGFACHAVLPREVLRYAGTTLLTRGFDTHDRVVNDGKKRDIGSYATSEHVTDLGIAFLARQAESNPTRRWFLWLHYFDVHEHDEIESDDTDLEAVSGDLDLENRAQRYAATVRLVDHAIGRFVEELQRRDLWRHTVVVFASDHGESLEDDPRLPQNHGRVLYNKLVHVPLLFRIPDVEPATLRGTASLVDITPTVRSLFGLPQHAAEDGVSLAPYLDPVAPDRRTSLPRPIILHESDQRGAIVWPHKILRRPAEGIVELFDLSTDFDEQHDLSAVMPDQLARMLLELDAAPTVELDRTRAGRRKRELMARPPAERDE